MQRVKFTFYIIIAAVFLAFGNLSAQSRQVDSLVFLGDSLRMQYRFEEACVAYERAAEILEHDLADSLMTEVVAGKILLAENGLNMADFTYSPKVVDRKKFSLDDFFLYFPLKDRSWRSLPNQLDSSSVHPLSKALYAPSDSDEIYFSAEGQTGFRNIYMTGRQDTVWTYPVAQNELVTAFSNEIYPMLSSDGKSLYFSSDGLYGVGGYDLYVSRWDEDARGWSEPVNMGFPYSSPYDDFLYVADEDAGNAFFASNRECPSDSVWVYVLEYDSMPVRRPIEDPLELHRLSLLSVEEVAPAQAEEDPMPESAAKDRYMDKMSQVRALRDSVSYHTTVLDEERSRFALSNDDSERMRLAGMIREREARVPQLQDALRKTIAELQEIEMEFLSSGIAVDPDKIMAAATDEAETVRKGYDFVRMSLGGALNLDIMRPESEFDYTFMILSEGRFAEDCTIPDGIIYQIQIFSAGGKATVADLKGLSPVFEIRGESGRYIYRAGLFNTYDEVQSKLAAVKARGFWNAFIVAYVDGEEVSVATARGMETGSDDGSLYEVRVVPAEGILGDALSSGIHQHSPGKDIARIEADDGTIIFVIGPFSDKADADALAEFVRTSDTSEVLADVVAIDAVNQ